MPNFLIDSEKLFGVVDMNVFVCQICKEPVTNFICPNRLATSMKDWLPSKIVDGFIRFHNVFLKHFNSEYCSFGNVRSHCESKNVICTESDRARVCAFCYITEVYEWLNHKNSAVAEQFLQIFSLGYKKVRYKFENKIVRQAITESRTWKKDSGICDECGEYSDELNIENGEWVCKACHGGH